MKFLKKYYKLIGTLITVVAFVFVIKKIVTMDVDWSMFASGKPLGIIAGCVLVQTAIIFFMSTPWVQFVRILSGKKIAMKDALPVYTKCNLMKYVPGNVFQYVGRNQLAADLHISHVDVACATVLEILCSLVAPLVWILLLMGKDMVGLIRTYEKNFLLVLGIGVAVLVLAFFLLRWKFREPLRRYFEKYRKLLNRKILLRVVGVFLLYVLQYLFSATMYAVPAFLMFDVPRAQMGLFLGTYLFSWVIGFITPGAPGGIGVREAVMVLTCSTFLDTNTIMLYAVTMRIISTFGDVLAFFLGWLLHLIWKRQTSTASHYYFNITLFTANIQKKAVGGIISHRQLFSVQFHLSCQSSLCTALCILRILCVRSFIGSCHVHIEKFRIQPA